MPGRSTPLITDQYYHVFNRGIDRRTTFYGIKEHQRAIECIKFYQFETPPVRLSRFLSMSQDEQENLFNNLSKHKKLIELISFTLMPNHYHLLIRQRLDGGISKFMSNVQNSYTRYFNIKHQRKGPLFEDQFKAVIIETNEQLLHLSRYIHLNPYSSFVVKEIKNLMDYRWSSLREYLGLLGWELCNKDIVLGQFKHRKHYKKFIFDRASYQRELKRIQHLTLED